MPLSASPWFRDESGGIRYQKSRGLPTLIRGGLCPEKRPAAERWGKATPLARDAMLRRLSGGGFGKMSQSLHDQGRSYTVFRIKICGITTVAEAEAVADAGADAIGLNFYPKSARCVDPTTAEDIVSAVGGRLGIVGVFVNASTDHMAQLADQLPLDYIQLHGAEPAGQLSELAPRRTIRALRLRLGYEDATADSLTAVQTSSAPPVAILVDAYQQGSFGGTGQVVNWGQVRHVKAGLDDCALILAGGLHPTNIRDAIHQTACDAVDVASGVELRPGVKDIDKMRQFVVSAMEAFGELEQKSRAPSD